MQSEIRFKIIAIITSTTPLDTQHLKVKDIERNLSFIKNYCIIISRPKTSSIQKFNRKIQQILGSHKLKDHYYPKIIEATLSSLECVASYRKKTVYANCSFLRYIQFLSLITKFITPILDHSHLKKLAINFFLSVGMYQHIKSKAISLICSVDFILLKIL